MRSLLICFLSIVSFIVSFSFAQEGNVDEEVQKARSFYFNPLKVKRDPFLPPNSLKTSGTSDLVNFDTNEMSLVAILSGMGAPKAMILLPGGKTHIVQKGDQIGRNRGRVKQITSSEVIVQETFKDYKNTTRSSVTKIKLAE